MPGVVLVHAAHGLVLAVWISAAAFAAVDKSLEEAARNLGASRVACFRTVTLPLATPGIIAGGIFVFLESLDEFTGHVLRRRARRHHAAAADVQRQHGRQLPDRVDHRAAAAGADVGVHAAGRAVPEAERAGDDRALKRNFSVSSRDRGISGCLARSHHGVTPHRVPAMINILRSILFAALVGATVVAQGAWTPAGPSKLGAASSQSSPAFDVLRGVTDTLVVSDGTATAVSSDGGATFDVVPAAGGFRIIAAGPANSGLVYGFGGNAAVSRSLDGGRTWQVVKAAGSSVGELAAVAPTNAQVIYGTNLTAGAVHSTDGGMTFSAAAQLGALPPLSLAVSPSDPNVVLAGTLGPLYKSTNGGTSFRVIEGTGLLGARAVAFDPVDANLVYALFRTTLHRSTDAGETFTPLPASGITSANAASVNASIAIDPANRARVYLGTPGAMWRSLDSGATWTGPLALPGGSYQLRAGSQGTLFYAGDRIYRSTDQGSTWTALDIPLSNEEIRSLAASPLAPSRIFAAGNTGNYRSIDNGRHFSPIPIPPVSVPRTEGRFSVDMTRADVAYLVSVGGLTGSAQLYRTTDAGDTWSLLYAPPVSPARPAESLDLFATTPIAGRLLAITSAYGGTVFRASYIHRSIDDGATWSIEPLVSGGVPVQATRALVGDPHVPTTLYLAALGFHRSLDGGATWMPGGPPFDLAAQPALVVSIAVIPTMPTTLLATKGLGVYRSVDGGLTWSPSSEGLRAVQIQQLAVDPSNGNTVYAALYGGGIFESNDAGRTWHPFNDGLVTLNAFSVLVAGGSVFAGTTSGVQRCDMQQCAGGTVSRRVPVVEFYNTQLDHYFMTADVPEIASIDSGGAGPGWVRTNATFSAWASDVDAPIDAALVHRFYGTPNIGPNSHFYTISPTELAIVRKDRGWREEIDNWFWMVAPAASGACPAGTTPIYRAYNNRFAVNDSNHRYTTSLVVLNEMKGRGWIPEGTVLCMPE